MPLVVKVWLYGAAGPVSPAMSSDRIRWASSSPLRSIPRKWNRSVRWVAAKWVEFVGHLVVVLQAVHKTDRLDVLRERGVEREAEELGVAGGQGVHIRRAD